MKIPAKKIKTIDDENLFGLLSSYKAYNTYIMVFVSDDDNSVILFITDNPKRFQVLDDEKYQNYKSLKRLEIGVEKLSIKYLQPEHLVKISGPMLGMKLPATKVTVINNIDDEGYLILQAPVKYLSEVLQYVKKTINMTPQKKYEIIEKCMAETTQG